MAKRLFGSLPNKSPIQSWKWKKRIEKLRLDLGRDVACVYAKDSARDTETQALFVDVSDDQIHKTSYFLPKLKVY